MLVSAHVTVSPSEFKKLHENKGEIDFTVLFSNKSTNYNISKYAATFLKRK
jgi:hypothetical protein